MFKNENIPDLEFDWAATLKMHDNNEDLAGKLAALLLETLTQSKQAFTLAKQAEDYQAIAKEAHKLRGGLCYISAPRLHYLCSALDNAYKEDRLDDIPEIYPAMMQSIESLKAVLSK